MPSLEKPETTEATESSVPSSPAATPPAAAKKSPKKKEKKAVTTATKKKPAKKGAKKAKSPAAKKAPSSPRGASLLIVLAAVAKLGGKSVRKEKILHACEAKGLSETAVGHQLHEARLAEPPLLNRKVQEDQTMEFSITASGSKLLAAK